MMPSRNRSSKYASSEDINLDYTKRNDSYTIQERVGLYGWRKRCLYILILFIIILTIINLTLIIWIIRVQDFGLHGMGPLHIMNKGIRLDGTAEFTKALRAKHIMSKTDSPLHINSRRNISLSAVDDKNNVLGQITLSSHQIVMKNKELYIQDDKGRTLLYADDKKLKIDIENMDITVPGGLNFESSIETPLVSSSDGAKDLRVESLTKKLILNGPDGIEMNSFGNDISFTSLKDIQISSKKGKIIFDAQKIKLQNIPQSSVPDSPIPQSTEGDVYGGIREVCMCKDGTLFLAPPDSMKPCKVTSGIC